MEGHVRALGYLFIIFSALLVLCGLFLMFIIGGSSFLSGDRQAALIGGGVGLFVGGLFLILAIPGIFAGFGLLKFKPWARILAIILGVLNILNFPFGTALGI